ncbi:hypothetical protein [Actinoplanes palleronii]|uniref:Flagellum-specific ATP synthase FliI n=1 Tax=Actinoplanes palleronii TaxID=113570 RepID=A0ABQ4BLT3_9ACTN|nr:hypothetical protein [Actinoplanes palleronii]GIE71592.1 hypothetical protein Apa02nite_077000 [Actinoplanes palleronii]
MAHSLLARDGFASHGELRMDGAEIGGSIRLTGAVLDNPGKWAVYAPGLRVGAVLDLSGGVLAAG